MFKISYSSIYNWTFYKLNFCLSFHLFFFYSVPSLFTQSLKPKSWTYPRLLLFSYPLPLSTQCSSVSVPVCCILTICTSTIFLWPTKLYIELCFLSWAQLNTLFQDNTGYLWLPSPLQDHLHFLYFTLCHVRWTFMDYIHRLYSPLTSGLVPLMGSSGKKWVPCGESTLGYLLAHFFPYWVSIEWLHVSTTGHSSCQVIFYIWLLLWVIFCLPLQAFQW